MVIPFSVQQRILPDLVKSSDISIPFAMRDIDCAIATCQDEAPRMETTHEALAIAANLRERAFQLLQLESVYLHRADQLCGGDIRRES